jgi:hypothetical protein
VPPDAVHVVLDVVKVRARCGSPWAKSYWGSAVLGSRFTYRESYFVGLTRGNCRASSPPKEPRFGRSGNEQGERNYGQSQVQDGHGTGCDHGEQEGDSWHDPPTLAANSTPLRW